MSKSPSPVPSVKSQPSAPSVKNQPSAPSVKSKSSSVVSFVASVLDSDDEEYSTTPEFIYGGPFIKVEKPQPFLNTATPINLPLQGTFKKTFAYYSLKERLPIILTKVIDNLSKQQNPEAKSLVAFVAKLKSDLVTNKKYEPLKVATPEAKRWNEWIANAETPYYFTNTWVFTECYVYRKLREGCEIYKSLNNFDPFAAQKELSFHSSVEPMCVVAERMAGMLPEGDRDKRKADFITLLKLCLWANKCDLSLSMGEQVSLGGGGGGGGGKAEDSGSNRSKASGGAAPPAAAPEPLVDPFQMIIDYKDKLLIDDSAKFVDLVVAKCEAMTKAIEGNTAAKAKCSCHRLATLAGLPLCKDEPPPPPPAAGGKGSPPPASPPAPPPAGGEAPESEVPCPAKMTVPQAVFFDIVCDNSGYELFMDLCVAHFVVAQKLAQKVRFHVKSIPWFVSDVTPRDFKFVIDSCCRASFRKQVPAEPRPEPAEGEAPAEPEPPKFVSADALRELGAQWARYVDDGVFQVMSDDFWTSPHVYKDMKRYEPALYRRLQFAAAILFKGDLNYRKLLGERNWNPTVGFELALQGFLPAPLAALRTVKAELICGLPRGRWEQLTALDERWMCSGDYGLIQMCPKAEPLKVAERPCIDYGELCRGVSCPPHSDL